MPPPVLKSFAAELYQRLAPMAWDDANQAYSLALLCAGIGEMFQIVEDLSRDQILANNKVAPGWSQVMDVNRCPVYALPWLAQFVGTRVDNRLTEAAIRQQVTDANNWKRGTLGAIQGAPKPYLSGNQTVIVRERWNAATGKSDPYYFQVITYSGETIDPVAVLNALLAEKPAGLVMTYSTLAGQDYLSLRTNNASYSAVKAAFSSYNGVKSAQPGI